MVLLACLTSCFRPSLDGTLRHGSSASLAPGRLAVSEDWRSVPDDVLQATWAYLSPSDVAAARLVCRRWRTMLSCYTPSLTLPTSFLSSKAARVVLRSSAQHFPSVNHITLCHTAGWCDPVQARMDVEPLVREERRHVSLEPVAAAFSQQLQQLSLSDASFTRQPWQLEQLLLLPQLSALSLSWDTALWAPGQVLLEAEALQPVFGMTQLTALQLSKHAHPFMGEVPLGDAVLAAAGAGLRALVRLDLATVSMTDQGFEALAQLSCLSELRLTGQLAVSLGVLARVFGATTGLQVLQLHGLLPNGKDLKRIAAAYQGGQHSRSRRSSREGGRERQHAGSAGSSSSGASSLSRSFGGNSCGSSSNAHSMGAQQQQQQQQQAAPAHGYGNGWRSSRLWQQQQQQVQVQAEPIHGSAQVSAAATPSTSAAARASSSSGTPGGQAPSSSPSIPAAAAAASATATSSNHCSGSGSRSSRFRSSDWSVVLLPLRRLRVLKLQSDLAFLGSCAVLRSMSHVTHVELHGGAKFMQQHAPHAQPHGALPVSWLTQLGRDAAAAAAAAASAGCSSSGASTAASSSYWPGGGVLRPGGVWPGLVSLHVDNLQLADGFIQGVAQLANLTTLVVSGPCLLAAQQQQHQPQQHVWAPGAGLPRQQHQQQRQPQRQAATSAPAWSPACPSGSTGMSALPALSGLSDQAGFSSPKALEAWATHKLGPAADPAAVLEAALAALKLGQDDSLHSMDSTTGSGLTTVSTISAGSGSSGGQRSAAPLFVASGMQPQLQAPMVAALAALQQQQRASAAPVFQPVLDADVMTRLSPLSQLSKFELHLQQQQLPCGLQMTPFALAHLSVGWAGLTSLCLTLPAPGVVDAAGGSMADDAGAARLFESCGMLQSLRHLSLTLADGAVSSHGYGSAYPHAAALPSTPEQLYAGGSYSSTCSTVAVEAVVAALPWHTLPASLDSLSLSGFIGIEPDNIKALAAVAPELRHLRLMFCQVPTSVLWALFRATPLLHTLVVKEDVLGGVGSSGMAAAASLAHLTSLAVTVEPGADVSVLAELRNLRYLLLDGRSNTPIRGIKGLTQLGRLRTLIMPLLHLHNTNGTLLSTLQLALPQTHIVNVSRSFGQQHGCQWFKCFSASAREWWAPPTQPWLWHPTLHITP